RSTLSFGTTVVMRRPRHRGSLFGALLREEFGQSIGHELSTAVGMELLHRATVLYRCAETTLLDEVRFVGLGRDRCTESLVARFIGDQHQVPLSTQGWRERTDRIRMPSIKRLNRAMPLRR